MILTGISVGVTIGLALGSGVTNVISSTLLSHCACNCKSSLVVMSQPFSCTCFPTKNTNWSQWSPQVKAVHAKREIRTGAFANVRSDFAALLQVINTIKCRGSKWTKSESDFFTKSIWMRRLDHGHQYRWMYVKVGFNYLPWAAFSPIAMHSSGVSSRHCFS